MLRNASLDVMFVNAPSSADKTLNATKQPTAVISNPTNAIIVERRLRGVMLCIGIWRLNDVNNEPNKLCFSFPPFDSKNCNCIYAYSIPLFSYTSFAFFDAHPWTYLCENIALCLTLFLLMMDWLGFRSVLYIVWLDWIWWWELAVRARGWFRTWFLCRFFRWGIWVFSWSCCLFVVFFFFLHVNRWWWDKHGLNRFVFLLWGSWRSPPFEYRYNVYRKLNKHHFLSN